MSSADRTSIAGSKPRRARESGRAGAPRPRTPNHWCSPCQLVAKGDERDCRVCTAVEPTPDLIVETQREARGDRLRRGRGAKDMNRYDLHGKPWGYKPGKGVPGFGPGGGKA